MKNPKSEYCKQIRASINSLKRDGFIGYWASVRAGERAGEFLRQANAHSAGLRCADALPIYQALIEVMVAAIQYADDSSGDMGDIIKESINGLRICAVHLDPKQQEALFDYLLNESAKKKYDGWDWQFDLLSIAGEVVNNDRNQQRLFRWLDEILSKSGTDDWIHTFGRETVLEIKCVVLRRRGFIAELNSIIEANISYSAMRKLAVSNAINEKRFEDAKKLLNQGIEQAKTDRRRGNENDWMEYLLEIAGCEKNIEDEKKYCYALFVRTCDFKYYDRLKQLYAPSEWTLCVDKILSELPEGLYYKETVCNIFLREENWQKMLEFVKSKANNIGLLINFREYLARHFPREFSSILIEALRGLIAASHTRREYAYACYLIRKMKKNIFEENLRGIVEWIRNTFTNRPALQDELTRILGEKPK